MPFATTRRRLGQQDSGMFEPGLRRAAAHHAGKLAQPLVALDLADSTGGHRAVVGQVREGLQVLRGLGAAEADAHALEFSRGKDPVERVDGPLGLATEVLQRAQNAGDEAALGAAVRAVEQGVRFTDSYADGLLDGGPGSVN